MDVFIRNIAGNSPENLVIAVVQHCDAVRQIARGGKKTIPQSKHRVPMTLPCSRWSMKSFTLVTEVKLTVPNFLKRSSISFFLLISLPPQYADCAVKPDTPYVMDEPDFRVLHLHLPSLSS
jgi:hypothetical protein